MEVLCTVVIPFFRNSETLSEAILSVRNQSFRGWQLFLIGNNPDEESLRIARKHEADDERIFVFLEERQGIAFALNHALSHVKTRYVARLDADDIALPERLSKQIHFLETREDYGCVSCQTDYFSDAGTPENSGFLRYQLWQNSLITHEEHFFARFIESPVAHPSVLFRSELIRRFGFYATNRVPEDYEMWLRWLDAGVRFYKIPEVLLRWRDSPERLTRTNPDYAKSAFMRVKARYLKKYFDQNGISEKKIITCGASNDCMEKLAFYEEVGIRFSGVTDIKMRPVPQKYDFIPVENLTTGEKHFFLSLIGEAKSREGLKTFFEGKNLREGENFLFSA